MLSKLSVKKPYTVIVGILLVLVLGYISFDSMTTDLLPSMTLPYVVVYTPWVGATPEQVEDEIVRPMEASFATLTDIKRITANASDNVGVVIMQFNDGANMDTALIEVSSAVDQLKGQWSEDVGAPVTMRLNPDMLPVAILSVSHDDKDILELSDYVTKTLVPSFESINGVASAAASGAIQQEIDITIEQSRIDVLNSAVLREIDEELADAEQQLNDAESQISDGRQQLARAKSAAFGQINSALAAIENGESQIQPAIEQMTVQRDELVSQRAALADNIGKLEQLAGMSDDQKAQLRLAAEMLERLKQQRDALAAQADGEGSGTLGEAAALAGRLASAKVQRDGLAVQRDVLQKMIDDLGLLDPDTLSARIAQQQQALSECEQSLATAQAHREELVAERDRLNAELASLEARPTEAPTEAPTDEPTEAPTEAPADAATETPTDAATEVPTETLTDEATEAPAGETTEAPAETPADAATEAPTEAPTDTVTEAPAYEAIENPTETPVDAATEAPTETPADEATEAPTETPVDAATEAPTETPADEATEAPTETPVDTATAAPTDAPADEATAEADSAPTEVPKEGSSVQTGTDEAAVEPDDAQNETADNAPAAEMAEAPVAAEPPVQSADDVSTVAETETARGGFFAALAEEDVNALTTRRDEVKARLDALNQEIDAVDAEIERLSQLQGELLTEIAALLVSQPLVEAGQENIEGRVAEAQARIATLDERITKLDAEIADLQGRLAQTSVGSALAQQQLALLDQQISALESSGAGQAIALIGDEDKLREQLAQAQDGLKQMDDGIAQLDAAIDKLKQGIIPGGFIDGIDQDTTLTDAKAMLESARGQANSMFAQAEGMLSSAAEELAKARKEFNDKRDEAYENAGLDGIITMETVAGLVGAQNMSMPAGYVKNADGDSVLVRVGEKFSSINELKWMKLFDLGLESIDEVRLLDVANVTLADNRDEVFTKLNGRDGILLTVEKQSTYSTADVAKDVLARARRLEAEDPSLHIVELMNQGEYIDIVVDSVLGNLISGGALAILVLLLFLMDWRPTLTVAFSIPISVVIAFVCMYFSGITLNVVSLSGLALGIGMLVDNSIVSIENIYRLHGEEHVPLLRACVEGVNSVSGALLASTLTTVCVFVPIVFRQGMARDLFTDMALTITFSLMASLLVAMTVVPMMTSFLMRRSKPKRHRVFSKLQAAYAALLRGALRVKLLVLLLAVGLLALSAMQVPHMGISFMPEVNSRQMSATLTPDINMSVKDQHALATSVMEDIMAIKGVDSIGLMSGAGGLLALRSSGDYTYYIIVDESAGRKNTEIAADIDALSLKYNADILAQSSTMDISMLVGSGISAEITGEDLDVMQAAARDIAEIARNTPGTKDVSDGLEQAVPEMRITVDKEKAINQKLTVGQVLQFVAQKLVGKVKVSEVSLNGKTLDIQLIEGRNSNLTPQDVENLEIEVEQEDGTERVRIGDIADVADAQSLSTISRADQKRRVTVSFAIEDGYAINLVSDEFEKNLAAYSLPEGCSVKLSGENESVSEIIEQLVWMIVVAVVFIFLIMVAQFQSFKSPIIVMFTIPLAFTGGLLALLLTRMELSVISMLGFLVLSGVVVNNGIVFIDCVNQLRIGGMEKREALVEAGRQRLRPILMTAMTTILGMSTMALGQGMGAEMMQPMAVVSIGGLSYATLMTLFVVPVLYDIFNGKNMRAREIQMIREAAGMNGDELVEDDAPAPVAPIPAESIPTPAPVAPIPAESIPTPAPVALVPAEVTPAPAEVMPSPSPAPAAPSKPVRVRLAKKR